MAYRSVRVLFSLAFVSALGATVVSEAGVTFATHGHNDLSSFGLSLDLMSIEAFAEAVDVVHPIRDVLVTLLHLLGLDDNRLTYFGGGRFKQLSQFGGKVIPELIS